MKNIFTVLLLMLASSVVLGKTVEEGPGGNVTRNDTGILIVTTPKTEIFSDGTLGFFPAAVCFDTVEHHQKTLGGEIPCHDAIPFPLPKGLK